MIVILSGEGKTDFGQCNNAQGICSGDDYQLGPMAILVKQMLEGKPNTLVFVSKAALMKRKKQQKCNKVSLVGKKQGQETTEFFINAWMLAEIAQEIEHTHNDMAIAIFFRDCDGTRSSTTGIWKTKWNSIIEGFKRAENSCGFNRGIPMLPKPKSEAWLICAAKNQPYQSCDSLESLSGNDDSPHSAKSQLDALLGGYKSAEELSDWMVEKPFDFNACEMPSFKEFKKEFDRVLGDVLC